MIQVWFFKLSTNWNLEALSSSSSKHCNGILIETEFAIYISLRLMSIKFTLRRQLILNLIVYSPYIVLRCDWWRFFRSVVSHSGDSQTNSRLLIRFNLTFLSSNPHVSFWLNVQFLLFTLVIEEKYRLFLLSLSVILILNQGKRGIKACRASWE